ncbi:MAG: hypothetical protein ACRDTM_15020 [Micromonosporaceae bacterium]
MPAAATAATLGLTLTASHAYTECTGEPSDVVCARLEWSSGAGEVRTWGKAQELTTSARYKLSVRLYRCDQSQTNCTEIDLRYRYNTGVYAYTKTTYWENASHYYCYIGTARLYRKGSDGVYRLGAAARSVAC